jgi:hypothetical protein
MGGCVCLNPRFFKEKPWVGARTFLFHQPEKTEQFTDSELLLNCF